METRTLISASHPIWLDDAHTAILMHAMFAELPNLTDLPYIARQDDCEQYGRDIFTRAANGEFGIVVPVSAVSRVFEIRLPIPPGRAS